MTKLNEVIIVLLKGRLYRWNKLVCIHACTTAYKGTSTAIDAMFWSHVLMVSALLR